MLRKWLQAQFAIDLGGIINSSPNCIQKQLYGKRKKAVKSFSTPLKIFKN